MMLQFWLYQNCNIIPQRHVKTVNLLISLTPFLLRLSMKKKDVSAITSLWYAEYTKRGVPSDITDMYISYVEKLIARDLPPIIDLRHLSLLIGIDYLLLVRIIHGAKSFYRDFTIPKRTGGERTITAPYPSLLYIQRWIYSNILSIQKIQFCAHGFVKDHSILTNALPHKDCKMLLKIDIKDFFGSIPQKYVINFFYKELGYSPKVAYFLSCICCLDERLPQGAPTSPALSNLICTSLDRRLYRLSKKFDLKYTRYADDLAFSGEIIPQTFPRYVKDILLDLGLEVNEKKTRLYTGRGSKIIAGISLASGIPRIPREYRRQLRQELHYIEKYGIRGHVRHNRIKKVNYIESLLGKLAFWLAIEPWNEYAKSMKEKIKQMASDQ